MKESTRTLVGEIAGGQCSSLRLAMSFCGGGHSAFAQPPPLPPGAVSLFLVASLALHPATKDGMSEADRFENLIIEDELPKGAQLRHLRACMVCAVILMSSVRVALSFLRRDALTQTHDRSSSSSAAPTARASSTSKATKTPSRSARRPTSRAPLRCWTRPSRGPPSGSAWRTTRQATTPSRSSAP